MPQCRSSGVKTASAVVFAGQVRLISIHATHIGTVSNTSTIKVFDNASAASGTELARMVLGGSGSKTPLAMEFDMHGVLAVNGLYLQITGESSAVSVEFN